MQTHSFGGDWTEKKLERLRKYLPPYMTILSKYGYKTMYVDAFAGTGYRQIKARGQEKSLFDELAIEAQPFLEGSAKIALDNPQPFDYYLFIDAKAAHVRDLEKLRLQYFNLPADIDVKRGDANQELQQLCENTNWGEWRGVVFLDPFGMSVDWKTIEMLGQHAKVDLWLLFPIGLGVNRVLTKHEPPPPSWSARLDRFFGTHDWQEAFYAPPKPKAQQSLFESDDEQSVPIKTANFDEIENFFVQRLKTVFTHVAPPMTLLNSQNTPLYLLCFASHNEAAANIAKDLLKD